MWGAAKLQRYILLGEAQWTSATGILLWTDGSELRIADLQVHDLIPVTIEFRAFYACGVKSIHKLW